MSYAVVFEDKQMFNVHILQKSQIPGNDHNLAKNEKNKTNT